MRAAATGKYRGMATLRTVSPSSPGWTRKRAGRGFAYVDEQGGRLGAEDGETIASVVRRNFPDPDKRQAALERAALWLLSD